MDYTREHIEIFANFISFAFQEMNINYWFQSKRVLCNITRWMDEIEMMTFDFVFKNYSSESVVFVIEEWFIPLLLKDNWFDYWIERYFPECELQEDDLKIYLNYLKTDNLMDILGINNIYMK
jgi:hypothetical protein